MAFRDYELPVPQSPLQRFAAHSYVAAAPIMQGQVVKADATDGEEATPSDADGEIVLGIAAYAAEAGDIVLVLEEGGRVRGTSASGTIEAGDLITAGGGSGEQGEVQAAGAGDYVIGQAYRDNEGQNDDILFRLDHLGIAEESA